MAYMVLCRVLCQSSSLPEVQHTFSLHAHATLLLLFGVDVHMQPLAVKAISAICTRYTVLDTHSRNYYKEPTAKIDIALSASPSVGVLPACLAAVVLSFVLSCFECPS